VNRLLVLKVIFIIQLAIMATLTKNLLDKSALVPQFGMGLKQEQALLIDNDVCRFLVVEEEDCYLGWNSYLANMASFLYNYYGEIKVEKGVKDVIVLPASLAALGSNLNNMILEHAHVNGWDYAFMDWFEDCCIICSQRNRKPQAA